MRWSVFLLVVPLFLAACWGAKEVEWHQKLTLHLQTPDGGAAFSSVTAMRCEAVYGLDVGGTKVHCREKGEALVAQLGERHLFVLLSGLEVGYRGGFRALSRDRDYKDFWSQIKRAEGQMFDVPRKRWPMFVSFEDVSNPASVFAVDPEDLAAVFGDGYAVERLTVGVTDQALTEGAVEAVLGWWRSYRANQYRLNGERCIACPKEDSLAAKTGAGQFKIEPKK
jgi:hypothetical protein